MKYLIKKLPIINSLCRISQQWLMALRQTPTSRSVKNEGRAQRTPDFQVSIPSSYFWRAGGRRSQVFGGVLTILTTLFMMPVYANVLNGPQYEVERLGPFDVPNPDPNGAAKCAALLPTPVPGGFPYATQTNLTAAIQSGAGAIAIANLAEAPSKCYPVKMYVFVPKGAPSKAQPAVIMLHGGSTAVPTPGQVDTDYATRLAANGIVVAYLDWQTPGFGQADRAIPSMRMSGVLDNFLDDALAIRGVNEARYLVSFTAVQETVIVAYDWLKDNASTFGIDPNAIGVRGDSFGGQLSTANYGLTAAGVIPAGFKFQIAIRSCYTLPALISFAGACTPLSFYENTLLVGPPLLAYSGSLDNAVPPPSQDQFIQRLQANGIPVEYIRLNANHDVYSRFLGWALADREAQFIYAATQNEGCLDSHELKNGKSACHLLGFVPEILDNSGASYDSCFNNRAAFDGHTYARCSGYEPDQWPLNWDQAKALCESHGGYLVKVDNAAENSFIYNWALSEGIETGKGPWLGANNRTDVTKWVWNDETSPFCIGNNPCVPVISGTYTNWFTGNPSANDNRCGAMRAGSPANGRWGNSNCISPSAFVCEFDQ